jgi:hypothetical protein
MWSLIKLDGQWYHLDVTWNDSGSGSNDRYLLKSDATMEKDHSWDHSKYPAAPNDYNTSGMTTTVPTTPTIPVTPTNPTNPTTPTTPTTPAVETVRVYKDGDWRVVPKDSIEYVPVPDVIGMEKSAALNVLRAAGFSVAGGYDEYSDTIPYNHVISVADMGNGIIEKDGQSVTIKGALISVSVSRGAPKSSSAPAADSVSPAVNSAPVSTVKVFKDGNWTSVAQESLEYVTIPDVVGLELSEARLVLKDAGFLVSMSGEYSSTVPLGYVISATDRTNGTVVKDGAVQTFKGATIAVVLSQGKSQ